MRYLAFIILFSENAIVLFFLMEYIVRFVCSPRKWRFFKQPMNLVDFFAIIPFMLDLVIGGLQVSYFSSFISFINRNTKL